MAHIHRNLIQFYSKFNEFRIAEKYSDVIIQCEEETFRCHRVILAVASNYFDAMFGGKFKESMENNVILQEMSATTFRQVLQFIYSGDVEISSSNVGSLLRAAEFFNLSGVEDLCTEFIKRQSGKLTLYEIFNLFTFVCAAKKSELIDVLVSTIASQFQIFSKTNEFLELSFEDLNIILNKLSSLTRNEETLLSAIIRWISHRRDERLQYFDDMLKIIQLRNISVEYMGFLIKELFARPSDLSNFPGTARMVSCVNNENAKVSLETDLEKLLYICVKCTDQNTVTIFSVNSAEKCERSENSWKIPALSDDEWIRTVTVDYYTLFCLQYIRRNPHPADYNQKFLAYNLLDLTSPQSLKAPPIIFEDVSLAALQNDIYVYSQIQSHRSIAHQNCTMFNDEEIKRGIYLYNCELDKWFPVPAMKEKQENSCIVAHYDRLYVIGGEPTDSTGGISYSRAYDYRSGKWQILPLTKKVYVGADCCMLNGKLYVCGGSYTVERFDPAAQKWEMMAPMIEKMQYHRVFTFANKIWAMGNFIRDSNNLSIKVYNCELDAWDHSSILVKALQGTCIDKSIILDGVVFTSY